MLSRIKRTKTGNEYISAGGLWIRNFTKAAPPIDINNLTSPSDRGLLIENQIKNESHNMMQFDSESLFRPNVCVVSDGHDFLKKQSLLKLLPANTTIIGVNRSLAKWDVKGRSMNYYLVNNPFDVCMVNLPTTHRYFPPCLASIRTHPEFLSRYTGPKLKYYPTFETNFKQSNPNHCCNIDEYRNPICAAICIAHRLQAVRILLFCCDDSFADERPGAEKLKNGLWTYPQHKLSHDLIEGNMYWTSRQQNKKVLVGDHSSGPEYDYVPYISEEGLKEFFVKELVG